MSFLPVKQHKRRKRKFRVCSVSSPITSDEDEGTKEIHGKRSLVDATEVSVESRLPISERQQLALLKQMTVCDNSSNDEHYHIKRNCLEKTKANRRNALGETPLHLAAKKNDIPKTEALIKEGADVSIQDNAGWTPLHEACNHNSLDVASRLLKAGACVNAGGLDNETPLHDAVNNGYVAMVKLLLQYGADPLQKNSHGRSALDVATVSNPEISALLEDRVKNGVVVQNGDEGEDDQWQEIGQYNEEGVEGAVLLCYIDPSQQFPVVINSSLRDYNRLDCARKTNFVWNEPICATDAYNQQTSSTLEPLTDPVTESVSTSNAKCIVKDIAIQTECFSNGNSRYDTLVDQCDSFARRPTFFDSHPSSVDGDFVPTNVTLIYVKPEASSQLCGFEKTEGISSSTTYEASCSSDTTAVGSTFYEDISDCEDFNDDANICNTQISNLAMPAATSYQKKIGEFYNNCDNVIIFQQPGCAGVSQNNKTKTNSSMYSDRDVSKLTKLRRQSRKSYSQTRTKPAKTRLIDDASRITKLAFLDFPDLEVSDRARSRMPETKHPPCANPSEALPIQDAQTPDGKERHKKIQYISCVKTNFPSTTLPKIIIKNASVKSLENNCTDLNNSNSVRAMPEDQDSVILADNSIGDCANSRFQDDAEAVHTQNKSPRMEASTGIGKEYQIIISSSTESCSEPSSRLRIEQNATATNNDMHRDSHSPMRPFEIGEVSVNMSCSTDSQVLRLAPILGSLVPVVSDEWSDSSMLPSSFSQLSYFESGIYSSSSCIKSTASMVSSQKFCFPSPPNPERVKICVDDSAKYAPSDDVFEFSDGSAMNCINWEESSSDSVFPCNIARVGESEFGRHHIPYETKPAEASISLDCVILEDNVDDFEDCIAYPDLGTDMIDLTGSDSKQNLLSKFTSPTSLKVSVIENSPKVPPLRIRLPAELWNKQSKGSAVDVGSTHDSRNECGYESNQNVESKSIRLSGSDEFTAKRKHKQLTKNIGGNVRSMSETVITKNNKFIQNSNRSCLASADRKIVSKKKQEVRSQSLIDPPEGHHISIPQERENSSLDMPNLKQRPIGSEFSSKINDFMIIKKNYSLNSSHNIHEAPPPDGLPNSLRSLFMKQEMLRCRLRQEITKNMNMLHLTIESEILRELGHNSRNSTTDRNRLNNCCAALCQQSGCSLSHHRNRIDGSDVSSRLTILQTKFKGIKRDLFFHLSNETYVLHATQLLDWGLKLKELTFLERSILLQHDLSVCVPKVNIPEHDFFTVFEDLQQVVV